MAEKAGHLTTTWKNVVQDRVVLMLRIIKMLADNGVDVIDAEAIFVSNKVIEVVLVMTAKS